MRSHVLNIAAIGVLAIATSAGAYGQSVKSSIPLSGTPEGIAVNFLTNRVYVAVPNFDNVSDKLTIIDSKTDTVIKTITIPPVGQSVAVDLLRNLVYVAGTYFDVNGVEQSQVAVISGKSNTVIQVIPITTTPGAGLEGVAVNPFNGVVYVSNASDNVIDVIRPDCKKVTSQISVAESPFGITLDPYNNRLYVALSDGTVDVIDAKKNVLLTTTPIGTSNAGIAVNWFSGNVYTTNNVYGTSTLGVLDKNGAVITNVPVGNTPFGVDVDLLTNLIFVSNTQDGTVSVINGKTNVPTTVLPVTGLYVAANPATSKVYVGGQDASVTVISEK